MSLYVFKDGQNLGPYEDEAVLQSLRNGAFTPDDLASREGQGDWRPLSFYFPLPEHQLSEAKTAVFNTEQSQVRPTDPFLNYQPPPAAPLAQYQSPAMMPVRPEEKQNESLASASWGLGIAALSIMLVGLIPCLGMLNYINFPLALGAIITGAIVMSNSLEERFRSKAQLGLILAIIAIVVGIIRLIIGCGVL
jgi:hypothetical protein